MSMLLSVLLAMSRLSGDSEITAMRAGGISLYRLALPIAAVGLVASLVGLGFQEFVVPAATAKANEILRSEIQSGSINILQNEVVRTVLPNGDSQVTYASGLRRDDAAARAGDGPGLPRQHPAVAAVRAARAVQELDLDALRRHLSTGSHPVAAPSAACRSPA